MLRTFGTMAVVAAFVVAAPAFAETYKLDSKGKCHDSKGHFAKADMCKGGAKTASATGSAAGYKLDAKGNCHDAKGKMAKKELCKA